MLAGVRPGMPQAWHENTVKRWPHPCPRRLDLRHSDACGLPGLRWTFPPQPECGDADEVGPHLTPRLHRGMVIPPLSPGWAQPMGDPRHGCLLSQVSAWWGGRRR